MQNIKMYSWSAWVNNLVQTVRTRPSSARMGALCCSNPLTMYPQANYMSVLLWIRTVTQPALKNSSTHQGGTQASTFMHFWLHSGTWWGTEAGDQRGWMGADQNFFQNRSVGLSPRNHRRPISQKSPQTLTPRIWENSYELAISEQQRPRELRGSKTRRNEDLSARDRSDRYSTPVRPVAPVRPVVETGHTGLTQKNPWTRLQTMDLEQTKSKSSETWRTPPKLSCKHIPKRSFPKDQRNLRIRGKIKKDWGFL